MFGHFTRDERNVFLALFGMLAVGYSYQALIAPPAMRPLAAGGLPPLAQTASGSSAPPRLSPVAPHHHGGQPTTGTALLDINTASAQQFEDLPGIGPSRARDIVAARQARGGFASIDDLDLVPGIGPATMDRLRPRITVSSGPTHSPTATPGATFSAVTKPPTHPPVAGSQFSNPGALRAVAGAIPVSGQGAIPSVAPAVAQVTSPAPRPPAPSVPQRMSSVPRAPRAVSSAVVNINTAGMEELASLDRIGPALARRIIEHRNARGPFLQPESLMEVPGIGEKIFARNRDRITVR